MMDIQVTLSQGRFQCGHITTACSFGRGGWKEAHLKREGDDATPLGRFPLRYAFFRADRLERPKTALDIRPLSPQDGWCDDITHEAYNVPVTHPFPASAEHLWRDDHVYDLILVIGHNDDPVTAGFGSAIFIHVARQGENGPMPTRGCIALDLEPLIETLSLVGPGSHIQISA